MHARLAALIALSLPLALAAGEFAGVQDLAARRAPWLSNRIRFEKLESDKDVFELRSQPDGVEIRASGPSARRSVADTDLRRHETCAVVL